VTTRQRRTRIAHLRRRRHRRRRRRCRRCQSTATYIYTLSQKYRTPLLSTA